MVADHPLLSPARTDNEAQGEVTERTDSRFLLQHCSQQKRSVKGKMHGLMAALDTPFPSGSLTPKEKWLIVAFLPLCYNERATAPRQVEKGGEPHE